MENQTAIVTAQLAEFQPFSKMARLNREVVVTEKIDGSNAQIYIGEDGASIRAGSRNRWLTTEADNFGFARWVEDNKAELLKLGPGRHFGEWWGRGIQRGYGLLDRRFSLFNAERWLPDPDGGVFNAKTNERRAPACCYVVPLLWRGVFSELNVPGILEILRTGGSFAAYGFYKPEGIVIYHTAAEKCFKVTLEHDESPKTQVP